MYHLSGAHSLYTSYPIMAYFKFFILNLVGEIPTRSPVNNSLERDTRPRLFYFPLFFHCIPLCFTLLYFSLVAIPPRICRSLLFFSRTLLTIPAIVGLISTSRSETSLCTVLLLIPNCFAQFLTVALLLIMYLALSNTLSSIYAFKKTSA